MTDMELALTLPPVISDAVVEAWLHEKFSRTGSLKTRDAYRVHLQSFRAFAIANGARQYGPKHPDLPRFFSGCIQKWAALGQGGGTLSPASVNTRIAAISSFFEYCYRYEVLDMNPATLVPRVPVQAYRSATPISQEKIIAALGAIDRKTLAGLRDYAILSVSLVTGRRLSEVANLDMQDIHVEGDMKMPNTVRVRVVWRRCKGGKTAADVLPKVVAWRLLEYMTALEEAGHKDIHLWIALAHNGYNGTRLGIKGMQLVCDRHVGTTRFHSLRHTFAHAMEKAGADVSEIQRRLMHSSLQTTGIYLNALRSDENKHADDLESMFGIIEDKPVQV